MKMKRAFLLSMMLSLVLAVHAETYDYLVLEKTDGTSVTFTAVGLSFTFSDGNLVTNEGTTLPLKELSKMYFSNTSGIRTLDLPTSGATAWTTTGIHMGTFNSHEEALSHLPKGIYIIKSSAGTIKTIVK